MPERIKLSSKKSYGVKEVPKKKFLVMDTKERRPVCRCITDADAIMIANALNTWQRTPTDMDTMIDMI